MLEYGSDSQSLRDEILQQFAHLHRQYGQQRAAAQGKQVKELRLCPVCGVYSEEPGRDCGCRK
jgi:DNA repair exonuclease SbcCD ATPase subunit